MDGLKRAAGWIVAAFVSISSAVAFIWYRAVMRDRIKAIQARANAAEKNFQGALAQQRTQLDKLKNELEAGDGRISAQEDKIAATTDKLEAKFVAQGLGAAEIRERMARVRGPAVA